MTEPGAAQPATSMTEQDWIEEARLAFEMEAEEAMESVRVQAPAEPAAEVNAEPQELEEDAGPAGGTGHPAVDEAVHAVVNASGLSASEQLAAYEGAHETLREVLASIEE